MYLCTYVPMYLYETMIRPAASVPPDLLDPAAGKKIALVRQTGQSTRVGSLKYRICRCPRSMCILCHRDEHPVPISLCSNPSALGTGRHVEMPLSRWPPGESTYAFVVPLTKRLLFRFPEVSWYTSCGCGSGGALVLLAHGNVVAVSAVPAMAPSSRNSIVCPAQTPYIVSYTTYHSASSVSWKYSQITCWAPYRHSVAARALPFRARLADASVP
jgi:hypothetical protein